VHGGGGQRSPALASGLIVGAKEPRDDSHRGRPSNSLLDMAAEIRLRRCRLTHCCTSPHIQRSRWNEALRKGLVVFQFGIVLVLSTAIAYDQIAFLSSKKLGIEMDQVVVFRNRDIYNDIKGVAREELLAHHAVVAGLKLMDGRRRRVTRVGVTGRSANLPRIWLS